MNVDIAEGQWKALKGEVKRQWGKITDDELDQISGSQEKFIGVLQKRYGKTREEAEEAWKKIAQT